MLLSGMQAACIGKNQTTVNCMKQKLALTQKWDKVFPLSENVNHKKVIFETQYGLILAADLYTPKGVEGKLAAIAVSGPFGATKEQSSGLYAMKMAERGFVALAFDPSYTGEVAANLVVQHPQISIQKTLWRLLISFQNRILLMLIV